MLPAKHDIRLYRGDDFELMLRFRDSVWNEKAGRYVPGGYTDLTGWAGISQIRTSAESPQVIGTFEVAILDQEEVPGGVLISMASYLSRAITSDKGVWDVRLTDTSNKVRTYIAGSVTVVKDVSR